jgi:hypothetical protein
MRAILVAVGLVVVATGTLVELRDKGQRRATQTPPAVSRAVSGVPSAGAAAKVFAGRLDGAPLQCRDSGSVRPAAPSTSSPPPLPATGEVIQAEKVTAMTVCETDFAPPVSGLADNGVRQLPITDPALAARIVEAANRRRQPPPGTCSAIGYLPSDAVLVRYGSHGVDRVGFGYGGCGLQIRSALSERWDTRVAPGYLGTVVPIAEAPTSLLATRDAPCLLRIPESGRGGRASPAPFVASTTLSVTICRYRAADDRLIDQQTLDPPAYDRLQRWLTALPRTAGTCTATSESVHDVLLVSDRNRGLYPIDLAYHDCGTVTSTFSAARYGARPAALELLAPGLTPDASIPLASSP